MHSTTVAMANLEQIAKQPMSNEGTYGIHHFHYSKRYANMIDHDGFRNFGQRQSGHHRVSNGK